MSTHASPQPVDTADSLMLEKKGGGIIGKFFEKHRRTRRLSWGIEISACCRHGDRDIEGKNEAVVQTIVLFWALGLFYATCRISWVF